jgi:hypothetical protein
MSRSPWFFLGLSVMFIALALSVSILIGAANAVSITEHEAQCIESHE